MDIARFWETIVNPLHDGLLVVDARGSILNDYPAAEKLTGYSAEELVGQNCRILNCSGCQIFGRGAGKDWCALYVNKRIRAKKCTISDKSGRALFVMKNASVLKDDHGLVVGAIETITDISEVVRQQQEINSLRQSCHLDGRFHGIIGHAPPMQRLFELIDNVAQSVAENRFREDLFFRINVFPLTMPALKGRMEDIPALVQNFIRQNNQRSGKIIEGLSPEALDALLAYAWPGNVRELRNTIE